MTFFQMRIVVCFVIPQRGQQALHKTAGVRRLATRVTRIHAFQFNQPDVRGLRHSGEAVVSKEQLLSERRAFCRMNYKCRSTWIFKVVASAVGT